MEFYWRVAMKCSTLHYKCFMKSLILYVIGTFHCKCLYCILRILRNFQESFCTQASFLLQSAFSSDNVIRATMSHVLRWKLYDVHTKTMLKIKVFRLINNSSQMTGSNNENNWLVKTYMSELLCTFG